MNSNPPIQPPPRDGACFEGIPAVAGRASGPAWVVHARLDEIPDRTIPPEEIDAEIARFHLAIAVTRQQILDLVTEVSQRIGPSEAGVFDAHLMVVDDGFLKSCVEKLIRERTACAEVAVHRVTEEFSAKFAAMHDAYLRERSSDILDIGRRILRNLMGVSETIPSAFDQPHIIISDDLTPSQTVGLPRDGVLGLVIDRGSATSHTAIIARALGIPAVVGLKHVSSEVRTGDDVLLDGYKGTVIVRPTPDELAEFKQVCAAHRKASVDWQRSRNMRAETPDGHGVTILANADHTSDLAQLAIRGSEGIGLYRTESLWMQLGREPDEDEQVEAYGAMVCAMTGRPVVIRVLDLGGDKVCGATSVQPEANPFLGLRSIRYLLKTPEVFRRQLRAILRVSSCGDVQIMYPMICDVEELRAANAILEQCKEELRAEGVAFTESIPVGAMIEIPSAALTAHILARQADFLCLGTNDLVQYTLAVDRVNETVASLYQPTHPSVLTLIRHTVKAGMRYKRPVSVCGEMAADPALAVLLMGMGVNTLSMTPTAIPEVKHAIRKTPYADATKLARGIAAHASTAADALRMCRALLQRTAPELLV
jgi:phosphoenolpyruvate-protein phosphotransferase (PTS system enzyme I)